MIGFFIFYFLNTLSLLKLHLRPGARGGKQCRESSLPSPELAQNLPPPAQSPRGNLAWDAAKKDHWEQADRAVEKGCCYLSFGHWRITANKQVCFCGIKPELIHFAWSMRSGAELQFGTAMRMLKDGISEQSFHDDHMEVDGWGSTWFTVHSSGVCICTETGDLLLC